MRKVRVRYFPLGRRARMLRVVVRLDEFFRPPDVPLCLWSVGREVEGLREAKVLFELLDGLVVLRFQTKQLRQIVVGVGVIRIDSDNFAKRFSRFGVLFHIRQSACHIEVAKRGVRVNPNDLLESDDGGRNAALFCAANTIPRSGCAATEFGSMRRASRNSMTASGSFP